MSATFEVFFDGACPLCRREIELIRRLDRSGWVRTTDIAAPGFDAEELGTSHAELMASIHGRLPDGTWVDGVEVFRCLYGAVGFGPLVALSRVPPIAWALDLAYGWFAEQGPFPLSPEARSRGAAG